MGRAGDAGGGGVERSGAGEAHRGSGAFVCVAEEME